MLTEPQIMIIKFAVYTETLFEIGKIGHANGALYLMFEKLNKGHLLYMNNFCNSFDLATKWLKKIFLYWYFESK